MYKFIWLIPFLPLVGAAMNGIFGRWLRFSERLISSIAVGSVALSFLISVAAIFSYGFSNQAIWPKPYVTTQAVYTWIPGGAARITLGDKERSEMGQEPKAAPAARPTQVSKTSSSRLLNVEWSYQLDPLSAVFMLIVTGVGLCIFVFATGYMHRDAGYYRFFAYMGLFMFSMLALVMSSNFVMLFVGWEGVGLCSYLLIGYYFDRAEAANASRKAFITNRIGDFGFMLAVFAVIATFGTAQYTDVMAQAEGYPIERLGHWGIMSWIALGLLVGACGKSAQLPLHVWLPDAMAGPTPVSALIHAATMVTAGLFMVTRANVIFQHSQTMMLVVATLGASTAIFAATIGITQNDIKRVLAYSTVSQLGFMFLACGVGAFIIGIFHVLTHAFFKALLFLGAGSVIHGLHHEQDMRRMGGLKKYMPYTYWAMLAAWLAICGIIPFSGFWSKDEILWNAASTTYVPIGWLLWIIGTIAATCTAFYMTRLMAMTFWGQERFLEARAGGQADQAHALAYEHLHGANAPDESPRSMWIPLVVLAVLATIGGLVGVGPAFKFITGSEHPGKRLNIVNWMQPVIWNPQTRRFGEERQVEAIAEPGQPPQEPAAPLASSAASTLEQQKRAELAGGEMVTPYTSAGFNLAHAIETRTSHAATEWLFILISLAAAGVGIGLGFLFYVRDRRLPEVWAARLGPLYRASFNKYWIDEFYGWAFTRRTMDAARAVFAFDSKVVDGGVNGSAWLTRLWSRLTGGTDKYFVDGIVNATAGFVIRLMSPLVRAAQTGLTQNYALVMVIGLLAAVALFFGKDILTAVKNIFAFIL